MCIYYKTRQNLKEPTNQEHIFPAFLGGKLLLPRGYVSDEANSFFSSFEKKLASQSSISLPRVIFGPGKRGGKKRGSITVNVSSNENRIGFSYIFNGKSYNCPHIYIKKDFSEIYYSQDKSIVNNDYEKDFNNFLEKLSKFKGCYIDKNSENIKKDELLIGYIDGYYFIGHSIDTQVDVEEIKKIVNTLCNKRTNIIDVKVGNGRPTHEIQIEENEWNARMFAKIGFNTLAYIMGEDFVLQNCFDRIREFILGQQSFSKDILPNNNSPLHFYNSKIHCCIFEKVDNHLIVMVCLYNSWKRVFDFGELNKDEKIPDLDGLVCDWENGKEYRLIEYISKYNNIVTKS